MSLFVTRGGVVRLRLNNKLRLEFLLPTMTTQYDSCFKRRWNATGLKSYQQ
jgi:hypothetical protein